jgi:hypothetical protein
VATDTVQPGCGELILQHSRHLPCQIVGIKRLAHDDGGHQFTGQLGADITGEKQQPQSGPQLPRRPRHGKPIHFRQADVADDQVQIRTFVYRVQRRLSVGGFQHGMTAISSAFRRQAALQSLHLP